MKAEDKIRKALEQIMRPDEANACAIWKSYSAAHLSTGWQHLGNGWHYAAFGSTAQYLGASVGEALETIEALADSDNA